jgi:type II secretory pathway pseudopilin PulG
MKNSLLATLSTIAIITATTQFASAGERQHVRKDARATATAAEQLRNANAAWIAQNRHRSMDIATPAAIQPPRVTNEAFAEDGQFIARQKCHRRAYTRPFPALGPRGGTNFSRDRTRLVRIKVEGERYPAHLVATNVRFSKSVG